MNLFNIKGTVFPSKAGPIKEASSIEEIKETESIFLVTPGRSGTKSFIQFCKTYTDFYCEHAPTPWLASIGYQYFLGNISDEAAKYAFYATREAYLKNAYEQGKVFLDGDCKNLPLINVIADLLPNSKFIHVVRRPEDFILSGIARGYYTTLPPELWGHLQKNEEPRVLDIKNQIRKIAIFWNEANLIAENLKNNLPNGRTTTVNAENFFSKPSTILDCLVDLNLTSHIKKCSSYSLKTLNKQRKNIISKENYLDIISDTVSKHCTTLSNYY